MTRTFILYMATLALSGCITEQAVVERSTEAISSDLDRALQEIGELRAELAALRDQVGETEETATLEERVRGLTQEGFAGRVGSLEVWRDDTVDPTLAALDARATTSEAALTEHGGRLGTLETWRVAVDGSLSDHETRIGALEDDVLDLIDAGSALTGRVTTLEGWRTGTADPTLTAHAASIGGLDDDVDELRGDLGIVSDTLDDSEARWITEDTTWEVGSGGDYETPEEAWEAALGKRVVNGAVLRLALLDGDYDLEDTWVLNHPDGLSLEIVGNEVDPGAVVLRAASGRTALQLSDGHGLGFVSGLELVGDGSNVGVDLEHDAFLRVGTLTVRGHSVGARLTYGSALAVADDGLQLVDCGNGINALYGSLLRAEGMDISGSGTESVVVSYGSIARMQDSSIRNSGRTAVSVSHGSVLDGNRSAVSNSGRFSFQTVHLSTALLYGVSSSSAGDRDYHVTDRAFVVAETSTGGRSVWSTSYGSILF